MMIDKNQEALDILLNSGAKIEKEQPIKGAIFMTLKPTEESNDEENGVANQSN